MSWPNGQGSSYQTTIDFGRALYPKHITIRYLLPSGSLRVQGASLIDDRSYRWGGAPLSEALTVDWRLELVNSGDLKVYRNRNVLPRAFIVHRSRVVTEPDVALQSAAGDLRRVVVLESAPPEIESLPATGEPVDERVQVVSYEPEHIVVTARLTRPGHLLLTDAYYPGWTAQVDGIDTEILPADVLFRAVPLSAGEHTIEFRYQPDSFARGLLLTVLSLGVVLMLLLYRAFGGRFRLWMRRTVQA
jgi:hypothetical protein